jgi:hypothetical protein
LLLNPHSFLQNNINPYLINIFLKSLLNGVTKNQICGNDKKKSSNALCTVHEV